MSMVVHVSLVSTTLVEDVKSIPTSIPTSAVLCFQIKKLES